MEFRRVDQDIDLAADHSGKIAHRFFVGHIERHTFDLRQLLQRRKAGRVFPRLRDSDPHDIGASVDQRLRDRLPKRTLAVRHQNFVELWITGHLAQHRIVRHVCRILRRQRYQHRLSALVEVCAHAHARWRGRTIAVQVDKQARTGIEPHCPEPQRHSLTIVEFVRVM